jgi:hypothetical protein
MHANDVAHYLIEHPDFFDQHPELLERITIPHPHNGQAISLVERQSLLLRDRIRALEMRVADMIRHGEENDAIADRLVRWARTLLLQPADAELPETALRELMALFNVPYGALRLWDLGADFAALPAAQPVSDDIRRLASSMQAPFCGSNVGFEVAAWMAADPTAIKSLAMIPLRVGGQPQAFGMLALGSADPDRFQITMGTAFLARLGELASAALAHLRAAP